MYSKLLIGFTHKLELNFMKKYLLLFVIIISLASCIPPGKLNEALDANTMLSNKYDSLNGKLTDTIANFSNSLSILKGNVNSLQDSVSYYRALADKLPVITEAEVFLNQMLGLSLLSKSELAGIQTTKGNNGGGNVWLEGFKADMKKYTAADADIKLNKGFVFVDISDKILFNSGSNALTKKSKEILATIAGLLQAQPDLSFMIEGHTDNKAFKKSSSNDNWSLSVNRATAVARILQTKYKINPKRIIAAGRSEFIPVDDNKTKVGRLNNRRIRIVIMPTVTQVMNLSK
jgi:chemotaxis protein MotB